MFAAVDTLVDCKLVDPKTNIFLTFNLAFRKVNSADSELAKCKAAELFALRRRRAHLSAHLVSILYGCAGMFEPNSA